MINPKELRIGNLVKCIKYPALTWRIKELHELIAPLSETNGFTNTLYSDFNDLNPIPLTHELLLKIGADYEDHRPFDKSYDFESYYFEAKQLYNVHIHYSHNQKIFYYPKYEVAPMKYLHQLQNLYFALTGEELEIKL